MNLRLVGRAVLNPPSTARKPLHLAGAVGTPRPTNAGWLWLLSALGILLSAELLRAQTPGAVIEGTVTLPVARGSAAPADAARYQALGKAAEPDGPAAIIYLEGAPAGTTVTKPAEKPRMVQQGMRFTPALLAVRAGTEVAFPNLDELYHNVFSYSKTKRFDLGRYLKDEQPPTVVFDQPGEVKLYCEIHSSMRATILVLDTPHFVKTGPDGSFRLENLPPGRFKLKAWLDTRKIHEQPVELKAGETLRVTFP